MNRRDLPPDSLEVEFRHLEREVRQRECSHEVEATVYRLGDPGSTRICRDCGREQGVPGPFAPVVSNA